MLARLLDVPVETVQRLERQDEAKVSELQERTATLLRFAA